ncbi:Protein vip1 [Madurella mycetomatis]|uniref:Protein vip1 n=1 Tax=Madurella mycetomatis TaxID=100816 RepID=A0A175VS59_9PEZI|nr:Protein vip1 [Madurella mycetomatis]
MATIVYVKNIGGKTEDKEIRDFFSFCGKINDINITTEGETRNATVTFEKETAARTALLLNHTQLGGSEISVSSESSTTPTGEEEDVSKAAGEASTAERSPAEGLTQEEKPRARILAEVLAHGYVVADTGLQKAIALDEKHGVSARFVATLKQLDEKTRATDHARAADASYGITQRASSLLTGLSSYFEKATHTPTGKRIVDFYTTSQRQVQDIHSEARRLAELKKEEGGGSFYKAVGLDKVFDRFGHGKAAEGEGEKSAAEVPGAAPADAAATESAQKPTAPSGTGNPETIH